MESASSLSSGPGDAGRRRCAELLAAATLDELQSLWDALPSKPDVKLVRGPETGLVMVRGRIGGGGSPFNLGEATVTRATVSLATGTVGHAQALGTDKNKAHLAACMDALWQEPATQELVETRLLSAVEQRLAERDAAKAEETAATRVDFFTMVRGDD